eukprot:scaffold5125_cov134-Isochrysis_galbana.AAC.2
MVPFFSSMVTVSLDSFIKKRTSCGARAACAYSEARSRHGRPGGKGGGGLGRRRNAPAELAQIEQARLARRQTRTNYRRLCVCNRAPSLPLTVLAVHCRSRRAHLGLAEAGAVGRPERGSCAWSRAPHKPRRAAFTFMSQHRHRRQPCLPVSPARRGSRRACAASRRKNKKTGVKNSEV